MKNIHDEVNRDKRWQDDRFDPPTLSWNIGINDHTAAVNITPAQSVCTVYFRPMPGMDADELVQRSRLAAERCGLEFDSQFGGPPMFTPLDSPFVAEVLTLAARTTPKTVCYGTDGAKFGELKNRVVCGPGDIAQAHTRDEWIALNQLTAGSNLYERMIQHWCTNSNHD
jgi:acetylornithine deacetylase